MRVLTYITFLIALVGCSSSNQLPQIFDLETRLNYSSEYDITQIADDIFQLSAPKSDSIFLNLYDSSMVYLGTLFNGTGKVNYIDLDSILFKYKIILSPGNYTLALSGQKGKAEFDLSFEIPKSSSYYFPFNNFDTKEEVYNYYLELAKSSTVPDTTIKDMIMPYPIGGIRGIQSKFIFKKGTKAPKIHGRVYIECWIDSTGKVIKTELLLSLNEDFDKLVQKILKSTRFIPGIVNGEPIKSQITIPIVY